MFCDEALIKGPIPIAHHTANDFFGKNGHGHGKNKSGCRHEKIVDRGINGYRKSHFLDNAFCYPREQCIRPGKKEVGCKTAAGARIAKDDPNKRIASQGGKDDTAHGKGKNRPRVTHQIGIDSHKDDSKSNETAWCLEQIFFMKVSKKPVFQ